MQLYWKKNIKFIGESLAKHIYGLSGKELEVFTESLKPNSGFISSWLTTVANVPRAIPFIPKNSPLMSGVTKVLSNYVTDVTNQTFVLESDYTFYEPIKVTMSAYKVKPAMFDVMLAGIVASYLSLLYLVLKGPTEAYHQIRKLISRSDKKGAKKKVN